MRLIISDIADMLLSPLLWGTVLVIVALLTRRPRLRRRLLIAAVAVLLFFSNAFVIDRLLDWWEPEAVVINGPYDVCVVLSGDIIDYDGRNDRDIFRCGSDRFVQALLLYRQGRVSKLFFSGRSGGRGADDTDEAGRLARLAQELGAEATSESQSRTTWQNAIEFKSLNPIPGKVLLLTSASHMRRAEASFRKAGVEVDIYPVGQIAGPPRAGLLLRFETASLGKWKVLMHEVVGYLYYLISGKA